MCSLAFAIACFLFSYFDKRKSLSLVPIYLFPAISQSVLIKCFTAMMAHASLPVGSVMASLTVTIDCEGKLGSRVKTLERSECICTVNQFVF